MQKGIDYIAVGCWGLVTNDQNEILLIKKKDNDYWERPGGNVEVGEMLEECVIREIKEETNINTEIANYLFFEESFFKPNNQHWIGFSYHLNHISGTIKNNEPEKHDDVCWFSINKLPKLSPLTQQAIDKYLSLN